ncbi:MAG: aspartate--ammonia ligase [Candidatus Aminicenantes bacterium]|nr:aspartate--ammonia ligase [Candidatus Aminicenantes bacterium]
MSTYLTKEKRELSLLKREETIFFIKQTFQEYLEQALDLFRISAPLFVERDSGMQDNLNGIEAPVAFRVSAIGKSIYEIVHSLAKWKRYALAKYNIPEGKGVYTDMNAIRADEESLTTGIHSVYVDQWDWEKVLSPEERSLDTLYSIVRRIYEVLKKTEGGVEQRYGIAPGLPEEIAFFHSEELEEMYPGLTPEEKENRVCRKYGAVFINGISRAPDYDDWTTPNSSGRDGLNGDILVWNPVLGRAFELSSMGIRVNKVALYRQLKICGCLHRISQPWHQMLLSGQLPESIGGGIGQSRLCMFLLCKRHIGEVQVSVWPERVMSHCEASGISLL